VYELLNINKQVPDINPLQYEIRHLLKATRPLMIIYYFPEKDCLEDYWKALTLNIFYRLKKNRLKSMTPFWQNILENCRAG